MRERGVVLAGKDGSDCGLSRFAVRTQREARILVWRNPDQELGDEPPVSRMTIRGRRSRRHNPNRGLSCSKQRVRFGPGYVTCTPSVRERQPKEKFRRKQPRAEGSSPLVNVGSSPFSRSSRKGDFFYFSISSLSREIVFRFWSAAAICSRWA